MIFILLAVAGVAASLTLTFFHCLKERREVPLDSDWIEWSRIAKQHFPKIDFPKIRKKV